MSTGVDISVPRVNIILTLVVVPVLDHCWVSLPLTQQWSNTGPLSTVKNCYTCELCRRKWQTGEIFTRGATFRLMFAPAGKQEPHAPESETHPPPAAVIACSPPARSVGSCSLWSTTAHWKLSFFMHWKLPVILWRQKDTPLRSHSPFAEWSVIQLARLLSLSLINCIDIAARWP